MATVEGKTIQTAAISAAALGANTVVKGAAGKLIYVHSYAYTVAAGVTVTWQDSAATPTKHSGAMPHAANQTVSHHVAAPSFIIQTVVPGTDLVLSLSAAVQVSGHLSYWVE